MVDRYSRQVLFPGRGEEGQKKLGDSSVVTIGCGALGTIIAISLVPAGVGRVRIVDRDFIECHNLQRQVLFDEEDIKNELPKAIAAERHLEKVNSSVEIAGVVADVNYTNIERLMVGVDLILDGLDNMETRLPLNDVSLRHKVPWVYGGAIAASGMTIVPDRTPCLRCVFAGTTGHGMALTCDTAGVISPAPFIVGSLQVAEAMKILVGAEEINRDLIMVDVWDEALHRFRISSRPDCPACQGRYDFLEAKFGMKTTSLYGQNAVQTSPGRVEGFSLEKLATRLRPVAEVTYSEYMLRFRVGDNEMVIFRDGRAILRNSTDESRARALYAEYVGA